MNGIKRAPTEKIIGKVQFFIVCLLIGFAIKHFFSHPNIHDLNEVYVNYWIIMDLIIIFLSQTYISLSIYMKVNGEIIKNIYSLSVIQKLVLRK